jgi:hypothetical protein
MRRKLSQSSTSTTASTEGLEKTQARDAYARQEVYNQRTGGCHDWCQDIAQEKQRKLDHIKEFIFILLLLLIHTHTYYPYTYSPYTYILYIADTRTLPWASLCAQGVLCS